MKSIFIILLFLFSFGLYGSTMSLDIGQTETVFNRISIPKSQANQITLPTEDTVTSFRLTGFIETSSKNQFYILIAPLEVDYNFTTEKNIRFNDTDFSAGEDTNLTYKFNSYRVGYLWTWQAGSLKYWTGFVGKIRDAKTTLRQGNLKDSFSNVGFVPLLSLGFDFQLTNSLSLFSHTDALGASQGSAYDSQLELKWNIGNYAFSIGRRILGGGADNDTVFNFAQFDTNYLRITQSF